MSQLKQLCTAIREVRQERIENRRKLRIHDRKAEQDDAVAHRFLQYPDLYDDEGPGIKVFAKIKDAAKALFTGNVDWAAVKKWLSENWIKVIQIILSVIGLAVVVGS
jgi:hypothetical protein